MTDAPARRELKGIGKLLVDFGPLVAFFFAFSRFGIQTATAVFMAATAAAILFSWVSVRHVPAMTLFSAVLVGVFGGLTLWLKDDVFIKMKPTVIYLIFASILFVGLVRKRNYLKLLFGDAFTGLTERGWRILALRWAIFFVGLAILNEIMWRAVSTEAWVYFKVWGALPLTFLFALAQIPMLKQNGLTLDDGK